MRVQQLSDILRIVIVILSSIAANWLAYSPRNFGNYFLLFSLLGVIFFSPVQTRSFLVTSILVSTLESLENLMVIKIFWVIILRSFYCNAFRRHYWYSVFFLSRCFLFSFLFEIIALFTLRFYLTFRSIFKERSTRCIKLFLWIFFGEVTRSSLHNSVGL